MILFNSTVDFYYRSVHKFVFWRNNKINKIGHCACTDVGISYGGDKFTTFSGEHAPLQVDLSLSFKEMELLNRQAVQNENNTGVWPEKTYTKSTKPMQDPSKKPKA